jgi:hypothetical protein
VDMEKLVKNMEKEITCLTKQIEALALKLQNPIINLSTPYPVNGLENVELAKFEFQPSQKDKLQNDSGQNQTNKMDQIVTKTNLYGTKKSEKTNPPIPPSEEQVQRNAGSEKRKLAIISTNNKHRICRLINKDNVLQTFACCHYITPGGGIKELFNQIERKLDNFSLDDYCVVLIGENDFESDVEQRELVKYINETLEAITTTNIIVACPTYKLGKPIYNSKVEDFNSMLLSDANFHKNHFSYDTNLNLEFDMFLPTGEISKRGTENIISHISNFISWKNQSSQTAHHNHNKRTQKTILDYYPVSTRTKKQLFRSKTE